MTRRMKIYWSLKSFLACISFVYICKYDPWNSKFFLTEQCHFCRIYWAYFLIIYNGFVLKQLVFSFGHLIFQQLAHQRKMDTFTNAKTTSCHIASHNAFDFKMNPDFLLAFFCLFLFWHFCFLLVRYKNNSLLEQNMFKRGKVETHGLIPMSFGYSILGSNFISFVSNLLSYITEPKNKGYKIYTKAVLELNSRLLIQNE